MKFDYKPIDEAIIKLVRDQIGSELATSGFQDQLGNPVPAVFQDQQRQYKRYPYVTIDRLSTRVVGGWIKNQRVNANDNVEYDYEYQCLYNIICYGEEAHGLLTHLKQTLSFEDVRHKIYTDSGDLAVFQRSAEVVESPELLATDFEPQSSMEITVNFTTSLANLNSVIITSAEVEGTVEEGDDTYITSLSVNT